MDAETRFKALIQPIKDIAANWDIDIAESLTEYLDELDNLRISIDGGKSNLNFAEAALLIQGSTAVYSKKVEYLHQLVLQSLEFITNKKSSGAQGNSKAAKTVDDDDALLFDGDASFLLLDHVIEEGRNINLKAPPPNVAAARLSHRMSNSFSSADGNTSRVSMSLMQSMLNDDQGTASLKLATSMVDGSGALLLCGSLPAATTGGRLSSSSARSSLLNSFQEHSRIHNSSAFHVDAAVGGAIAGADADVHMNDDGDAGGYYDDGPGDDWGYEGPDAPVQDADGPAHPFSVPAAPGSPSRTGGAINDGAPRSPVAGNNNARGPLPPKARKPGKDVFAQLDPHIVVTGSRDARRAKTYKIPAALQRAAPVNPTALRVEHLYADLKKSNIDILREEGKVPMKGLFNPSLLPILQAKRKQVRRARILQMRQQRLLQAGVEGEDRSEEGRYQNLLVGQGPAATGGSLNVSRHEALWSQDYDDGDNDMGGGGFYDDGGADDGYAFADGPGNEGEGDNLGGFSSRRASSAADVLGDGGDQGFGGGGDDFLQESEEEALARRVAMVLNDELNQSNRTSYESICQKYIANFSNGADAFARETQLSRRVAEWTQRLEPILQQQEEAAQFDIHAYCEQFLEEVDGAIAVHAEDHEDEEEEGEVSAEGVSFGEVVAGKPSGEVCRIFLACLQLVNHGNISITPARGVDQWTFTMPAASVAEVQRTARQSMEGRSAAVDPFKVKVNSNRHGRQNGAALDADCVENYRAPSLQDKLGVPKKSAMKGANGKGKGTKRVHVDIPSNIFISI